MRGYQVVPIGWVESALTDRGQAPRQGDEGAPDAWLVFEPEFAQRNTRSCGRNRDHRAHLA